jgi:hypothetical protein
MTQNEFRQKLGLPNPDLARMIADRINGRDKPSDSKPDEPVSSKK